MRHDCRRIAAATERLKELEARAQEAERSGILASVRDDVILAITECITGGDTVSEAIATLSDADRDHLREVGVLA